MSAAGLRQHGGISICLSDKTCSVQLQSSTLWKTETHRSFFFLKGSPLTNQKGIKKSFDIYVLSISTQIKQRLFARSHNSFFKKCFQPAWKYCVMCRTYYNLDWTNQKTVFGGIVHKTYMQGNINTFLCYLKRFYPIWKYYIPCSLCRLLFLQCIDLHRCLIYNMKQTTQRQL